MNNNQQPQAETHFFEASDPTTGAQLRLPLNEPPVAEGDSLDLRGMSLKNLFIFSLFQLEISTRAPEEVRQEAKEIRPMLEVLIESITPLPAKKKETPQYDFKLIDTQGDDTPKFAAVDKWMVDRVNEIERLIEKDREAGAVVSENLTEELAGLSKVIREKQQLDMGQQLGLVRSVTSRLLSTQAAHLAMRMISMTRAGVGASKKKAKSAARVSTKKPATFRQSGHLVDQKLPTKDEDRDSGMVLYNQLNKEGQERLIEVGIEPADTEYGIKLSASESKLVNCLSKLLHEKSQTSKPKKRDYYVGNGAPIEVPFGQTAGKPTKNEELAPRLLFTPYELAKAYNGGGAIGGKEVKNVMDVLRLLAKKPFIINYTWWEKANNGNKVEHFIKEPAFLFRILQYGRREYNEDDVIVDEHEELKIALNPIFRHQIDTKYVEYPSDIIARTAEANGNSKVPLSTELLLAYLLRERSAKRWNSSIYEDKLHLHLCQDWIKQGRKRLATDFTNRAIDTMKTLGIITDVTRSVGKTGTSLITFHIGKDWV